MLKVYRTYHNPADGGYNQYTVLFGERGQIAFILGTDGDDATASHTMIAPYEFDGKIIGHEPIDVKTISNWELKYFMRALREAISEKNNQLTWDDGAFAFALAKELLTTHAQQIDPFHLLTEIGELVY